MNETDKAYEVIRAFSRMDLLQSGQLVKAQSLASPERLSIAELRNLHNLGFAYCEAHPGIIAVAYTEFSNEHFRLTDANPAFNNIIYLSHNPAHTNDIFTINFKRALGNLLLNPQISYSYQEQHNLSITHEQCGSIRGGKIFMLTARESMLDFRGYLWKPDMQIEPQFIQTTVHNRQAMIIAHEKDHLNGLDLTYRPEILLDPFAALPERLDQRKITPRPPEWIAWLKESVADLQLPWLVYRQDKLVVLDPQGTFIEYFRR